MGTMTILRGAYPRLARRIDRPVGWLSRGSGITPCSMAAPGRHTACGGALSPRDHPVDRRDLDGRGTLAMIGGTVVIVGF